MQNQRLFVLTYPEFPGTFLPARNCFKRARLCKIVPAYPFYKTSYIFPCNSVAIFCFTFQGSRPLEHQVPYGMTEALPAFLEFR